MYSQTKLFIFVVVVLLVITVVVLIIYFANKYKTPIVNTLALYRILTADRTRAFVIRGALSTQSPFDYYHLTVIGPLGCTDLSGCVSPIAPTAYWNINAVATGTYLIFNAALGLYLNTATNPSTCVLGTIKEDFVITGFEVPTTIQSGNLYLRSTGSPETLSSTTNKDLATSFIITSR